MFLVGRSFCADQKHWTFVSITQKLGMPSEFVREVLSVLEGKELLVLTQSEPPAYLPARDLEMITLNEIISAVRISGEDAHSASRSLSSIPEVDGIMQHIDDAITSSLGAQTLKDLVLTADK
jgi:membrane protein